MKKSLVFAFKDHCEARNSAELMFTQALVWSYAVGTYPQNFIYYFSQETPAVRAPTFFSPEVFLLF